VMRQQREMSRAQFIREEEKLGLRTVAHAYGVEEFGGSGSLSSLPLADHARHHPHAILWPNAGAYCPRSEERRRRQGAIRPFSRQLEPSLLFSPLPLPRASTVSRPIRPTARSRHGFRTGKGPDGKDDGRASARWRCGWRSHIVTTGRPAPPDEVVNQLASTAGGKATLGSSARSRPVSAAGAIIRCNPPAAMRRA
jgi:hypothetical protein